MITKVGRAEIIDECVRLIKEGDIVILHSTIMRYENGIEVKNEIYKAEIANFNGNENEEQFPDYGETIVISSPNDLVNLATSLKRKDISDLSRKPQILHYS